MFVIFSVEASNKSLLICSEGSKNYAIRNRVHILMKQHPNSLLDVGISIHTLWMEDDGRNPAPLDAWNPTIYINLWDRLDNYLSTDDLDFFHPQYFRNFSGTGILVSDLLKSALKVVEEDGGPQFQQGKLILWNRHATSPGRTPQGDEKTMGAAGKILTSWHVLNKISVKNRTLKACTTCVSGLKKITHTTMDAILVVGIQAMSNTAFCGGTRQTGQSYELPFSIPNFMQFLFQRRRCCLKTGCVPNCLPNDRKPEGLNHEFQRSSACFQKSPEIIQEKLCNLYPMDSHNCPSCSIWVSTKLVTPKPRPKEFGEIRIYSGGAASRNYRKWWYFTIVFRLIIRVISQLSAG